jgi:hypothetical protein
VALVDETPPMRGGEYLRPASLLSLQDFLKNQNRRWRLVGRVNFNLAENRRDPEFPFAFMATYASNLSANGELRRLPLGQALR